MTDWGGAKDVKALVARQRPELGTADAFDLVTAGGAVLDGRCGSPQFAVLCDESTPDAGRELSVVFKAEKPAQFDSIAAYTAGDGLRKPVRMVSAL